MNSATNEPFTDKFRTASNAITRYLKNATVLQQQAYCLGKRDALTHIAQLIMHDTNEKPLEISVLKVLEYTQNRLQQLEAEEAQNSRNSNENTSFPSNKGNNTQIQQTGGVISNGNSSIQTHGNYHVNPRAQEDEVMDVEQSHGRKEEAKGHSKASQFSNTFSNTLKLD